MNVILFILTILTLGAITAGIIFSLYMILTNFTPGQSKIAADVEKMKSEIQPWIEELVPWKKNEFELLSFNNINKQIKKGIVKTAKGVFTSIYQEPLIAYSFKQYFGKNKNGVLYARTADREFQYRIREKHVDVLADGLELGQIRPDGRFMNAETKQLAARINRTSDELTLPIIIKDREVAGLLKTIPGEPVSSSTRAFEYVNSLAESEETLVLSMTIWELLKNELPLPIKVEKEIV